LDGLKHSKTTVLRSLTRMFLPIDARFDATAVTTPFASGYAINNLVRPLGMGRSYLAVRADRA